MPVDKFGRISDTKTRDTGVSLTYIDNNYIRSDGTTPVSGSINMNGNTLYNVSNPVNPQDEATKEYVDDVGEGGPFLKENGNYKATHTINMAYNKLLNLHKPIEPYDAATKDYVDYVGRKSKHLIIVHAKYCGVQKFDEYPFKFSGGDFETCDEFIEKKIIFAKGSTTGFLMPHSGNTKKIVIESIVYVNTNDLKTVLIKTLEKDNVGEDIIEKLTEEEFFKEVVKKFETTINEKKKKKKRKKKNQQKNI